MATYTPIPYWLSLPWVEVCEWAATIVQIQGEERPDPVPT